MLFFFLSYTFSYIIFFFFSSRRRHTRFKCDWSSDVCSSDLQALVKKSGIVVVKLNGQPGGMSGVFQQRRGPGRYGPVSNRHWMQEEMEEGVPNDFQGWIRSGANNEFVMGSVISEIGFSPGERLDVQGKSPGRIRLYDFAKVTRGGEGDLRERSAVIFHTALIVTLVELPELVELGLAIKVGQNLIEAFQRKRVRRQILPAQFKRKFRGRPRSQCKGNETGKGSPGVREGMLLVVGAQGIDRRPLQCQHPLTEFYAPRALVRGIYGGIKSGRIERTKSRE